MSARALPGASARRERLGRERTASQLRRQAGLEAEVAEQLEPLLGPAGRPVGDAAMSAWRRRRVAAYLGLAPHRRAQRTWVSWGRVRRAATVLALAPAWALVCLPLRMLGLAGLGASHAGVAAFAVAAPVAAFVPWRVRGRFVDPLPEPRPPWRGSRAALTGARAAAAAGAAGIALVAVLAALGPGPAASPPGRLTPAARSADVAAVRALVADACGAGVPVAVTPIDPHRYRAQFATGQGATVVFARGTGFAAGRSVAVEGGAIACPAP